MVGQSGSGKSTIVQLLMRFYTPGSGSITIDEVPIDQYNISDLRHQIGIVPQDVILFGAASGKIYYMASPARQNKNLYLQQNRQMHLNLFSNFQKVLIPL